MRKVWLVAAETYKRRIRSGTFLVLTFGLPVLMVLAGAIPILLMAGGDLPASVGLVDQVPERDRSLAPPDEVSVDEDSVQVRTFASVDAARAAYDRGEVGGFLVVPAGYREGEPVAYYSEDEPGAATEAALTTLLRQSLVPGQPAWLWSRLENPSQMVFVGLESGEEVAEGPALVLRIAAPIALGMLFALAVLLGSSQMGAAVVREKDQRSIEMVVTSLGIRELVAGKVLGVSLLTLTQFAVWGVGAAIGIGLALASVLDVQDLVLPWRALVWALLLGVPSYFLYGTLAAGLGVIAGDSQQARQLAGVLGLVAFVPFWFSGALFQAPHGPAAIALSLFPLTSPMFSLLRMAMTEVPTWQLAAALVLILASLAVSVWFVARIFRAAMLVYGKPLRPREILQALRRA